VAWAGNPADAVATEHVVTRVVISRERAVKAVGAEMPGLLPAGRRQACLRIGRAGRSARTSLSTQTARCYERTADGSAAERVKPPMPWDMTSNSAPPNCRIVSNTESLTAP
jgi:hypothetical protein